MNENPRDAQLFISEASQGEDVNFFIHSQMENESESESKRFLDSTFATRSLEEKNKFQKAEGIQMRELLLPSSSAELSLSPSLMNEQEMELEEKGKKKKTDEGLKLIKKFCAVYYEVTPIACLLRERWAFSLWVFICSRAALLIKRTSKLVPRLLFASYCCLAYQMFENVLLYRSIRRTTNSRAEKVECLFDLADKALLGLAVFLLDLQHSKRINGWFMFLSPLLFLLEIQLYRRYCSTAQTQENDRKVIWRVFCLFQTAMIAAKVTNVINFKWKETLVFLWSYIGIHALYAPFALLLLLVVGSTSIMNRDVVTIRLLKNKTLGYIWNIGFNLLNGVGFVVLFGLFKKIDSKEDDMMRLGLTVAESLSLFLAIYSAVLFPILKKANFNLFQDLGTTFQEQVAHAIIPRKKYNLVKTEDQNKTAFFLMISPTYFHQLKDISQEQFEEMMMKQKNDIENTKEEESLCYICENYASNAVLLECGHGGVCCECVVKSIEKKNECMECRKPARAIYKIETESVNRQQEVVVQAHEMIEITQVN